MNVSYEKWYKLEAIPILQNINATIFLKEP